MLFMLLALFFRAVARLFKKHPETKPCQDPEPCKAAMPDYWHTLPFPVNYGATPVYDSITVPAYLFKELIETNSKVAARALDSLDLLVEKLAAPLPDVKDEDED